METDLFKAALPVVGGLLALMGGIFTFVSGRLRDAADEDAKARVLDLTWLWIAVTLWVVGQALSTFSPAGLFAIPLYVASLAIHWRLFVSAPEPATRKAIAVFAMLCAVTGFAVLFTLFAHFLDRLLDIQSSQIELFEKSMDVLEKRQ